MDQVPSTPDPTTTALTYALIRYVLAIMGAFGVTWGASVSGQSWQIVAGAIAGIIGLGLSIAQKYQAARHAHETAIASAVAGKPVQPAH